MKPMNRFLAPLLASALLAPALLLSGCGGNVSFPDTVHPLRVFTVALDLSPRMP